MENHSITVVEKPDWVLWEDIQQCLYDAHSVNRANGINMSHYQWSVEKIKETIGEKGVTLVALDDKKVVGTASFGEKYGHFWYANGRYAYLCFAGILPEYNGRGIYKALCEKREEIAKSLGYSIMVLDTHYFNRRLQRISADNGFRFVRFFRASTKDHYSVVMAKWLDGCPYSKFYCHWKYEVCKIKTLLLTKVLHR